MFTAGFDKLLNLTDSRYRLSMIVAKRSVQLKAGFPNLLAWDEYPKNRAGVAHYEVALAIQELLLDKSIIWGETLPSDADLLQAFKAKRDTSLEVYTPDPAPQKRPLTILGSKTRPSTRPVAF